jgi:3-oxoacyl-[acyl-carrier protein] reductase
MRRRTVLITGASKGIGLGLVQAFLDADCNVIALARTKGGLETLRPTTKDARGALEFFPVDLSKSTERQRAVSIFSQKSEIDVIIHNVGGATQRGNLLTLDEDSWVETFQLNVLPAVTITRGLWSKLTSSANARVLFVGSLTSLEPGSFDPHYSAAKAAILNFSKHIAKLGASHGVLCNTLLPGPIRSDSLVDFFEKIDSESASERPSISIERDLVSKIPLGRLGMPSDLEGIAKFLCSEENKWITGANLKVDGGKSMGI